ncbi:MAG: hypothetical protein K5772_08535 [Clostridia bacterium]|nr:hypothetical protein [Clostridia bacterium]
MYALSYIILTAVGVIVLIKGLKTNKVLTLIGGVMTAIGLILLISVLLLVNSTSNSEPNPAVDPGAPSQESGEVGDEDGEGADWRTWRSYTEDFELKEGVTVCLSALDDGNGYAAYDSSNGDRIGTLKAKGIDGQEEILCEDQDDDGVKELGIVKSGETLWFRYTGEAWVEGVGGGCFEPM